MAHANADTANAHTDGQENLAIVVPPTTVAFLQVYITFFSIITHAYVFFKYLYFVDKVAAKFAPDTANAFADNVSAMWVTKAAILDVSAINVP